MPKTPVVITAIWLRRSDKDHAEVLVEIDGKWKTVICENLDGPFSHIAEGNGVDTWKPDRLDPRDPDYSRQGIFQTHNCYRCLDGALPCIVGTPNKCEFPRARND
jgi:hypothetical protein